MTFRDSNAVKNIQLQLNRCGVYSGTIDGIWGSGCRDGFLTLLKTYLSVNGVKEDPGFIKTGTMQNDVITELQLILRSLGLYTGTIDGLWGRNTLTGLTRISVTYMQKNGLPDFDIAWSKLVSPEFIAKIKAWVKLKGFAPEAADWLMACMYFESGGTFNPAKQNNGGSNYFGLIQFGSAAAKDLGYSLDQVKAMSQLVQLDLVFAYFELWMKRGKRYTQLEDFYLTILYPVAVGKKADEVLFRKDLPGGTVSKNYSQNNGFDKNKDALITIGEICNTIYTSYYNGMLTKNRRTL